MRTREVLGALRRSGGATVAVPEAEIEKALFDLSRIGLYAEPTSALAAAGLTKLIERGVVQPGETTVVVLTGSGPEGDTASGRTPHRRAHLQTLRGPRG